MADLLPTMVAMPIAVAPHANIVYTCPAHPTPPPLPPFPPPLPATRCHQAPLFVHWNNRPWPTNMIVIDNHRCAACSLEESLRLRE